jgi:hypothetical protein
VQHKIFVNYVKSCGINIDLSKCNCEIEERKPRLSTAKQRPQLLQQRKQIELTQSHYLLNKAKDSLLQILTVFPLQNIIRFQLFQCYYNPLCVSSPFQGSEMQLRVRIVEAVDLTRFDGNKRPDPFCLIRIAGHDSSRTLRTSVRSNTERPSWIEEFCFSVVEHAENTLQILVKSEEVDGVDETLSLLSFDLSQLTCGELVDSWFDLSSVNGFVTGGKIRIAIKALPPPQSGRTGLPDGISTSCFGISSLMTSPSAQESEQPLFKDRFFQLVQQPDFVVPQSMGVSPRSSELPQPLISAKSPERVQVRSVQRKDAGGQSVVVPNTMVHGVVAMPVAFGVNQTDSPPWLPPGNGSNL